MVVRRSWVAAGVAAVLASAGCFSPLEILNDDFVEQITPGGGVATLPGGAPGVVVNVSNLTNLQAAVVISYRDGDGSVQVFTVTLQGGGESAQMLVCPVVEITAGSVSDLTAPSAVLALTTVPITGDLTSVPYLEVEGYGVLLREGINFECGDGITFVLTASATNASGYEIGAYIRSGGAGQ